MVSLRLAKREELEHFDAMDRQEHARHFIIQTGIATHQKLFSDPGIIYLSIEDSNGKFCGYFILALEPETQNVEFRRILIDQDMRGIGQFAIKAMELYCREQLQAKRIWLDVFESNEVGMHIYEKLGYKRFNEGVLEGQVLYFYEKSL